MSRQECHADIEIQYVETSRSDSATAEINELCTEINRLGLTTEMTVHHQRSLETIASVSIIVGGIGGLLKLFGVADYIRTRMQERAKYDAARANEERTRRADHIQQSAALEVVRRFRRHGIDVSIELRIPPEKFRNGMDANGFGGFSISGQTRESISEQIEAYIHHARGLKTLIDSEILPEPILGGVYTKLLEGGDLEVKWIRQSDMRTEIRVLRRSI